MNAAYLDLIAAAGAAAITHIALIDGEANEVGDARKAVTWTSPDDGTVRPNSNLVFDMEQGDDVAGWVGYSALTAGTAYGGAALTPVEFSNPGTYTLLAASTGIAHDAA